MGCKILCEQNSPASIDLQREPGVSAVALSSRRAAVRPIGEHHTLPDSRRYRAQSLSWFMFPAAFLHLCLNLPSTLQSGLRMQSMMGYHLVGIVSDRTEGCAGLLKEQLRCIFSVDRDVYLPFPSQTNVGSNAVLLYTQKILCTQQAFKRSAKNLMDFEV